MWIPTPFVATLSYTESHLQKKQRKTKLFTIETLQQGHHLI
jgi:hypothetical protein